MELPSDLPEWAHPTRDGVEFALRCDPLTSLQRTLAGAALAVVPFVLAAGEPLAYVGIVLLVVSLSSLGLRWVVPRRVAVTLTDDELEVEGVRIPRGEVSIGGPTPNVIELARRRQGGISVGPLLLPEDDRRWLFQATSSWAGGRPLPPRGRPRREAALPPDSATRVGVLEPGQQTIAVGKPPVRASDGVWAGLLVVAGGIGSILLASNAAVPAAMSPWLDLAPVILGVLLAATLRLLARPTVFHIRSDALLVRVGEERRTFPYADIRRAEARRRSVHSELRIELADGSVALFPVRGFPVAATVEEAIRAAMERSNRERETPESRRALDALRVGGIRRDEPR